MDLRKESIATPLGAPLELTDLSQRNEKGGIAVHFRDLSSRLVEYIGQADCVVGCVAWITHEDIIKALGATKHGCSFIVQKEDWWGPVPGFDKPRSANQLRARYELLGNNYLTRRALGGVLASMRDRRYESLADELEKEWFIEDFIEPIRCVGYHAAGRNVPRAHHKFAVFCRYYEESERVKPYAVWTGSYNFTLNADRSFENAVYIEDAQIVRAYYYEYLQVACLSEPMDWTEGAVVPEWHSA